MDFNLDFQKHRIWTEILGTEIQKLVRTALETFDFSPFLITENNYNEVLSKSRRKNFKSFDDDQKFQEFEIRKKDVIRVSEELTSLYADFLPNDFPIK